MTETYAASEIYKRKFVLSKPLIKKILFLHAQNSELQYTTSVIRKFSNERNLQLSARTFPYLERLLSISTYFEGMYRGSYGEQGLHVKIHHCKRSI